MRLYYSNGFIKCGSLDLQAGKYLMTYMNGQVIITDRDGSGIILPPTIPSNLLKADFTPYASWAEIKTALSSYFVSETVEDPDFDQFECNDLTAVKSVKVGVQSMSASAAITKTIVKATGGSSGINATLPAPASGLVIIVEKIDSGAGAVTILQNSAEKINGANSLVLYSQYDSVVLNSDGTNWFTANNTEKVVGEIKITDGSTAQSIANGTDYVKLTGYLSNGMAKNCTPDYANSKITITKKGTYKVVATSSGICTGNETFTFQIHVDNTPVDGKSQGTFATGSVRTGVLQGSFDVTSVPVDLDIRAKHGGGSPVNLTLYQSLIRVEKVY